MRRAWEIFKAAVNKNCLFLEGAMENSVEFWQNKLFAGTMAVVIPGSLLSLVGGIVYGIVFNLHWAILINIFSYSLLLYIAFGNRISLINRKIFLMLLAFLFSGFLLIYLGIKGPGFLLMYSTSVFGVLILPVRFSFLWSWINLLICLLFLLVAYLNLSPVEEVNSLMLTEIIISISYLLLLSFITSALLPKLLIGLSHSFQKEQELKEELSENQKKLNQVLAELETKNQDLEMFAYSASHDLQEPLRMVNGFLQRLSLKYSDTLDAKANQYIDFAVDGAQRMSIIIKDLLELSRIGRENLQSETIALEEVVEEILYLQQAKIKEKNAIMRYSNLPLIVSKKIAVLQILQNLIGNALKFSKKDVKPEILIHAKELPSHWEICVKDNGIGIKEADFEKIFIIFQRLHGKSEFSGSGIGLAMVKKNIELLGGAIRVESQPEKGSTFCFTIKKESLQ